MEGQVENKVPAPLEPQPTEKLKNNTPKSIILQLQKSRESATSSTKKVHKL